MKDKRKLIAVVFMLALSLPLLLANSANAAAYQYGYKAGDKYMFHTEMNYSSDTPSGKASQSITYDFTLTIIDVIENFSGHRVNIQYTAVGGAGGNPVTQSNLEGNPTSFTSGGSFSIVALFVTTDWDNRSTEWSEYVDSHFVSHDGYSVQNVTHDNGEFSVNVNLDLDSTHSDVDFNGDGINDAYTGTISYAISYDSNGVLKSASMTETMTTVDKGTVTTSSVTERQTDSTIASSAVNVAQILTIVGAVAATALALGIGFFLVKRRTKKGMPQMPPMETK